MNIEVRHPEPHNIHAMKKIWQTCFGDTDDYVDMFFNTYFKPELALVAFADLKPVGIMFMLPATLCIDKKEYIGEYIYAAAVNPDYRKMGIMRTMERAVQNLSISQGLSFLALIPQTSSLYKMYEKFGYRTAFYTGIKSYMPFKSNMVTGIKMSSCSKEEFIELRNQFMKTKSVYIDLLPPFDSYRYAELKKIGGNIMKVTMNNKNFYLAGIKRKNDFYIKETSLDEKDLAKAASFIANEFGVDTIRARGMKGHVDTIVPLGMFKSFDDNIDINTVKSKRTYMNLMLD